MSGDRVRYWAALNSLRTTSALVYADDLEVDRNLTADIARPIPRLIWGGIGLLLMSLTAVFMVPHALSNGGAAFWSLIGIGVGGLILFAFAVDWGAARLRGRDLAEYRAAEPQREQWRLLLAGLADRWDGTLETTGTDPTIRFLVEHWSDRGPGDGLLTFRGVGDNRLTVTGSVRGLPVLLHVADFWPNQPKVKPPLLFLLVAHPLAPLCTDPDAPDIAATPAGQRLVEAGLYVQVSRAGAWVVHPGPATTLLSDEDRLHNIAGTVVDLCRQLPPGEVVASSPDPVEYPIGSRPVMERFLNALIAGDSAGALAYADPEMFAAQQVEPAPQDIDELVRVARARPTQCHRIGPHRRLHDRYHHHLYETTADFAEGPPGPLAVYLIERGSRWAVAGYDARDNIVLGRDFPRGA